MGFLSPKAKLWAQVALVSALSCAGFAFGATMLLRELKQQDGPGSGPVLAKLREKTMVIRRKRASRYSWSEIAVGDGFYHRESLESGPGARAILSLEKDGSIIEVGENSLVVFDENSEYSFQVLQGNLSVVNKKEEKKIVARVDGSQQVTTYKVTPVAPVEGQEVFTPSGKKRAVIFSWSSQVDVAASAQLLISQDAAFSAPLVVPITTQVSGSTKTNLNSGTYYWKVVAKAGDLSRTTSFYVTDAAPIKLGEVKQSGPRSMLVRWELPVEMKGRIFGDHTLQIASDENFKTIDREQVLCPGARFEQVLGLNAGDYFVRIMSKYGDLTLMSDVAPISLQTQLAQAPDAESSAKPDSATGTLIADAKKTAPQATPNRTVAAQGPTAGAGAKANDNTGLTGFLNNLIPNFTNTGTPDAQATPTSGVPTGTETGPVGGPTTGSTGTPTSTTAPSPTATAILAYNPSSFVFPSGAGPIPTVTPLVSGGTATCQQQTLSVTGLHLNSDCSISGTPSPSGVPPIGFTIDAIVGGAQVSASISIEVTSITYDSKVLSVGQDVGNIKPHFVVGNNVNCSPLAGLPPGLSMNSDCSITGTPTQGTERTTFYFSATIDGAGTPTSITLTVASLAYPQAAYTFTAGVPMTPTIITPTAIPSDATPTCTPTTMVGLALQDDCSIIASPSPWPTQMVTATPLPINATVEGVSVQSDLNITVVPLMRYLDLPLQLNVGLDIGTILPTLYGAPGQTPNCSGTTTPPLPLGLTLSSNCAFVGIPTLAASLTTYTINASVQGTQIPNMSVAFGVGGSQSLAVNAVIPGGYQSPVPVMSLSWTPAPTPAPTSWTFGVGPSATSSPSPIACTMVGTQSAQCPLGSFPPTGYVFVSGTVSGGGGAVTYQGNGQYAVPTPSPIPTPSVYVALNYGGGTGPYTDKIMIAFMPSNQQQTYHFEVTQGGTPSPIPISIPDVPGNSPPFLTTANLAGTPTSPGSPDLRIKIYAQNGVGQTIAKSAPVLIDYCIGDVDGNGVVNTASDTNDINLIAAAASPTPYPSPPSVSIAGLTVPSSPFDLDWNFSVIGVDNITQSSRFSGTCPAVNNPLVARSPSPNYCSGSPGNPPPCSTAWAEYCCSGGREYQVVCPTGSGQSQWFYSGTCSIPDGTRCPPPPADCTTPFTGMPTTLPTQSPLAL